MASAIATAFMIPVVFLCASDSREKLLHEVDCCCGMKISLKNLFSVLVFCMRTRKTGNEAEIANFVLYAVRTESSLKKVPYV